MTVKLDCEIYGYTKFKSQIACSESQKSEISKKHKDDIILNLFKRLKKDKVRFYYRVSVKHIFRNSNLEVLGNKNTPRLIMKYLRKHHAPKQKLSHKSSKGCFFY